MSLGQTCIVVVDVAVRAVWVGWQGDVGEGRGSGNELYRRRETDLSASGSKDLLRSKAAIKARNVDVIHWAMRIIRHRRLEVDATGRRRGVLIVGSHGECGWYLLLDRAGWLKVVELMNLTPRRMIEVSDLRVSGRGRETDVYRCWCGCRKMRTRQLADTRHALSTLTRPS